MTISDKKIDFDEWLVDTIEKQLRLKRPPISVDALKATLIAKLPRHLAAKKAEINSTAVFEIIDDVSWKKFGKQLQDAAKGHYTPEEFHELLLKHRHEDESIPPLWAIRERFQAMHGYSSAPREKVESLPGILRVPLTDAPAYSLANTSYKEPFRALSKRKEHASKFAVIAAPQLGLAYDKDIFRNLTRSGFSAARKIGCDTLFIAGGLFRLAWQKTTGPNRLLADLVTGTEIDFESIEENYRPRVEEIISSGSFEPIFTTAVEQFNDILRGYYKVTIRPDGRPEFEGEVYIVLNPDDLGLVRRMAYFELLYKQNEELREAEAETRLLFSFASKARKHLTKMRRESTKRQIKKAEKAYETTREEALEASRLVSRMRMTNLDPTQNRRVYDQVLSYLIQRIEESIPNATVIDQNSAYFTIGAGKEIFKLVSGGDSPNPYNEALSNYGPSQRDGTLPDLTIVAHPRALGMRGIKRENYRAGTMIVQPNGFVEAPILVDPGPLLERTRGTRIPLPVMKAVSDPLFFSGMLVVSVDPVLGITPSVLSAEAVRKIGAPQRGRPAPPVKKLWLMESTDMHFGSQNRLFVHWPSGVPIGLSEAACELMKPYVRSHHGLAPVAGFIAADDQTQGNHFDGHNQPSPQRLSNARALEWVNAQLIEIAAMPQSKAREESYRALSAWQAEQIMRRTPDHLGSQLIELHEGLLLPYTRDIFKGIILKAHASGVQIRTMSDITGQYDKRDIGLIMWGSGNHAFKTANGAIYEGQLVRDLQRNLLRYDPDLLKLGIDIERCITAPLSQGTTMGYGRLKVGNGYEWGIEMTGTPPKRLSWNDTLSGYMLADRQRGNPSTILEGCHVVHFTGDKHFACEIVVRDNTYAMGSPDTYTDAFANIAGGLPENNAGKAFIGLPVDGPDSGEISFVHMTPKLIQDFLTSGKEVPWEEFLPNSI